MNNELNEMLDRGIKIAKMYDDKKAEWRMDVFIHILEAMKNKKDEPRCMGCYKGVSKCACDHNRDKISTKEKTLDVLSEARKKAVIDIGGVPDFIREVYESKNNINELINRLKKETYKIVLLSGDNKCEAIYFALECIYAIKQCVEKCEEKE
ncbi:hypothetical protein LCGC14_3060790 [marine sediment metagenome]|uniref:Uncharacterized protein n=1 Tax=marine sediment metagenome TaxID=412755 RepID=A0A0F8YRQ1_9ZZZZ